MSETRSDSAVVVLGMHRSGTSALTGVLRLCGLSAPRTLIPSSETNERGFWESAVINALNDSILHGLGLTWRSLDPISAEAYAGEAAGTIAGEIAATMEREFDLGHGQIPLIKDPRICRLLPFWQRALAEGGANAYYPIILRHPAEIALSLQRRNDIEFEHALLLWARYYLDAEQATRGKARSFLLYSDLLDDWRTALRRLHSQLSLPFDMTAVSEVEIEEYLSADLRHQRVVEDEAERQVEAVPFVSDAFRILSNWAGGSGTDGGDQALLDEARRQLDQVGHLLSGTAEKVRLERKRRTAARSQADEAAARLTEIDARIEDLDRAASQVAAAASEFRQAGDIPQLIEVQKVKFDDLGRRLRKLLEQAGTRAETADEEQKRVLAATNEAIARLNEEVREQAARNLAALDEVGSAVSDVGALANLAQSHAAGLVSVDQRLAMLEANVSERARLDAALSDALEQARELRQQLLGVEQSEREARAEARRHHNILQVRDEELAALNSKLAAVSDELKTVKRKYRSTQQILARERVRLKESRDSLVQAEAVVARVQSSHIWRLYLGLSSVLKRFSRMPRLLAGRGTETKQQAILALIDQSGLFDRDWYLETYQDVAKNGLDPVVHYLEHGWREGRDPGPGFSTTAYLKANADVAAHGFNPLLHYVEYGHSEGRGAPESASPSARPLASGDDFGPAAPCASFVLPDAQAVRWARSGELAASADRLALPDGAAIGRAPDKASASAMRAALDRLAWLSGSSFSSSPPPPDQAACAEAIDMWFETSVVLRTRWCRAEGSAPLVVRSVQCVDAKFRLVGEAIVTHDLDMVDAKLANKLFPVLFVFSDPTGLVVGTKLLAFPSLCRGGIHYPELAVRMQDGEQAGADAFDAGREWAAQLTSIRSGDATGFIREIDVDLSAADGTETLYQSSVQTWLRDVVKVSVKAASSARGKPVAYLVESVVVEADATRADGAATLRLAGNMFPSIAALCAIAQQAEIGEPSRGPALIVAGESASQPAVLVRVPPEQSAGQGAEPCRHWPALAINGQARPASDVAIFAVREASKRRLAEAELLVPRSGAALTSGNLDMPISWLVWPEAWSEAELLESLEALGAQTDIAPASLIFVGQAPEAATDLAARLFGGRVANVGDRSQLPGSLDTRLVGYLGPRVILHDRRTAAVLSALLSDPTTISASVAIVAIEKRGKGFLVSPTAFGGIGAAREANSAVAPLVVADALWRSSWSCTTPPRDLWVTRVEKFEAWLTPTSGSAEGAHACSAIVTASYCGPPSTEDAPITPHAADELRAIALEAVVG